MYEHIASNKRQILIPKGQFQNESEARAHVLEMGYKADNSEQHATDNFYKYNQGKQDQDYNYREKQKHNKAVYHISDQNNKIISKDHHKLINHESLTHGEMPQQNSLFNPKIKTNGNIINMNEKPLLGRDGRGIWQQQYQNQNKSELTASTPIKPSIQLNQNRIQYTAFIQPRKSYLDMSNSKNVKKYF